MYSEIQERVAHEKEMYQQISQDNKMAAIGQLAAGVAHEIRNPLGAIRNYCYLIKNSKDHEKQLREEIVLKMETAVGRSSDIINNLLDFSRISNELWARINLKTAIEAILAFEEHLLAEKNIKTTVSCRPDLSIYTIEESLNLIMANLLINAVDAIDDGSVGEGKISVNCIEHPDSVIIEVSDNGIGMDESTLEKVFNPFFTTKIKNKGSGLGLYIVYNEVEKIKGKIALTSNIGKGTVFTISLGKFSFLKDDREANHE
jgi:polar amino acid transport system substrate-binding protein